MSFVLLFIIKKIVKSTDIINDTFLYKLTINYHERYTDRFDRSLWNVIIEQYVIRLTTNIMPTYFVLLLHLFINIY